jgi:glycosyltransferase involved in cell wall biosynthesis
MIYINGKFLTQQISGVQRFAIEILKELDNLSLPYLILAPQGSIHPELETLLKVKVIGTRSGTLWEQIDLPLYLNKRTKPLLLNLCNTGPLLYRNQIATIHDLSFLVNPKWFSWKFVLWYKFMIPILARTAKHLITVSEFSKNELINLLGITPSKISVVYNAVAFKKVTLTSKPNTYGKYLLFVGSIDPRKNLETLIKAFQAADLPDMKLLLVGKINKNFNQVNLGVVQNIVQLGNVDDEDLAHLYQHAFAFVYPSLYEGFGIPPLEAMAFSCPVICSNAASLPEVCGDAALYFEPLDTTELTNALIQIDQQPAIRQELIRNGLKRASLFLWKTSSLKLANIIKTININ